MRRIDKREEVVTDAFTALVMTGAAGLGAMLSWVAFVMFGLAFLILTGRALWVFHIDGTPND